MPDRLLKRALFSVSLAAVPVAGFAAQTLSPSGPSTPVLAIADADQAAPAVARAPDGRYVVVWSEAASGALFGRRFTADGLPLDGGFQISAPPSGTTDTTPDVAIGADGAFVVTWLRNDNRAFLRAYGADGVARSGEQPLEDAGSTAEHGTPSVACDDDGDCVIAWDRHRPLLPQINLPGLAYGFSEIALGTSEIAARRYRIDGQPVGAREQVALRPDVAATLAPIFTFGFGLSIQATSAHLRGLDVAIDDDGDFAVAWNSFALSYVSAGVGVVVNAVFVGSSIRAQRYTRNGSRAGLPLTVDAGLYRAHFTPRVAMDGDGDFVVGWSDNHYARLGNRPDRHRLRAYRANGLPRGAGREVPMVADSGPVLLRTLNMLPSGDVLVGFEGSSGIQSRVVSPTGTAAPVQTFRADDDEFPSDQSFDASVDASGNAVYVWRRFSGNFGPNGREFQLRMRRLNVQP